LLVLDTDHFSEWQRDSAAGQRLRARFESATPEFALTVVTVEEQLRGWLAEIGRERNVLRQISAYGKLQRQIDVFADWLVLPWETESANLFLEPRRKGIRIGTLDLKIACIVLTHDATLLTRNSKDFQEVPGLRLEDWTA